MHINLYGFPADWEIVVEYNDQKVTINALGEILGPVQGEIEHAEEDEIAGDITDRNKRSGSKYSPYQIASVEDLVAFSKSVNEGNSYEGKYIELGINIDFNDNKSYKNPKDNTFGDLNEDGTIKGIKEELTDEQGKGFMPIGKGLIDSQITFNGNFNGNYKKIKNIYINNNENQYLAFFANSENATIENLGLEGGKIINSYKQPDSYGIIDNYTSGICIDFTSNKTEINNCYSSLNEIKGIEATETYVAGIAFGGSINGCYNTTDLTATKLAVGIGRSWDKNNKQLL